MKIRVDALAVGDYHRLVGEGERVTQEAASEPGTEGVDRLVIGLRLEQERHRTGALGDSSCVAGAPHFAI